MPTVLNAILVWKKSYRIGWYVGPLSSDWSEDSGKTQVTVVGVIGKWEDRRYVQITHAWH